MLVRVRNSAVLVCLFFLARFVDGMYRESTLVSAANWADDDEDPLPLAVTQPAAVTKKVEAEGDSEQARALADKLAEEDAAAKVKSKLAEEDAAAKIKLAEAEGAAAKAKSAEEAAAAKAKLAEEEAAAKARSALTLASSARAGLAVGVAGAIITQF